MIPHRYIVGFLLVGLWALYRFRRPIWIAFLWMCGPGGKKKVTPMEQCWCCGAKEGDLEAVMQAPPASGGAKTNAQLFIKYKCKICGAWQLFAPIVPNGEVKIAPCARVGPVQGKVAKL